ncbi:transcription termination/antitermination protein NusA [Mycoplasma phocoenae]|uniref:Transcription termination/antitermination protein NusA n=1 Tax=Mycoplasma phocoenae TaxID=754517 RepID=A0A858U605_9MOLU|nr:transcription termination/antitermination protein NusA [Mycoplasma phocoenae]QJG66877.1 transcription termination/antitermination protein NusA [Mycoplasma phocoenae]
MENNFFEEIYNLSQIKGIPIPKIKEMLETTIRKVFEKFDPDAELEFIFDEEKSNFKVINHTKMVVEDPQTDDEKDAFSPSIEITLTDARKIDPNIELEDNIAEEVLFEKFPKRVHSQILSQFNQLTREFEKQRIYEVYSTKIGEIVRAKFVSKLPKGFLFNLENNAVDAFMPHNKAFAKNMPSIGSYVDVVIEEVMEDSKAAQIIVSSSAAILLEKTLKSEIPEIADGQIEVVKIARMIGERSKVAVKASEGFTNDVLGSIIGKDSMRIQNIEALHGGEKIEVVEYSDDIKTFIMNAIAPSKVIDVIYKANKSTEKQPAFDVVVPESQHTLAIGQRGINVMLAVELTGAKINVVGQKLAEKQGLEYEWNGNVTPTEVEELEQGRKLRFNTNKQNKSRKSYDNQLIDLSGLFDKDIADFHTEFNTEDMNDFESKLFEDKDFDMNFDQDMEDLYKQIDEYESNTENDSDEKDDTDPYSKVTMNDYKEIAKQELNDFKEDKDLSVNVDDIDWDDSEWE